MASLFRKKGVMTIRDLLDFGPRTYEDRRAGLKLRQLQPGQTVSVDVEIVHLRSFTMGRSRKRAYEILVKDETSSVLCRFFRVPFKGYFEQFESGQKARIVGKVSEYRARLEFHHPELRLLSEEERALPQQDELVPVYPETEGLSSQKIRKFILQALGEIKKLPQEEKRKVELLPPEFCRDLHLPGHFESLERIHQPLAHQAEDYLNYSTPYHRRLIFEDFFWLELYMLSRRAGIKKETAPKMELLLEESKRFRDSLPFQLTNAQRKAFKEIAFDLTQPHPMHRILQGDVGSGKTIVALLAAMFTKENKMQTAFMVPTEILSEQHFKNASEWLEPLGLKVGRLTGSMRESEKRQVREDILSGNIHLVIGTHALIQEEIAFSQLGLVIVDEQHRFGVEQRGRLKQKGKSPHVLLMSATPIPRTLSLTVYGDLDVSLMNERPKGRIPIATRVAGESYRRTLFDFMRSELAKGRQAYVIYPLVKESEKIDLKDAESQFERLKIDFPQFQVGLLHGKMKADEKEKIMEAFKKNEIQILVSTTVVEVGVDVPNATVLVIEHAERFGLSQLHQLRGRVGRGQNKSYCFLMMGPRSSAVSRERATVLENTDDGFKIAEADLELRGPGEFVGSRQSGLPEFKVANLLRDQAVLMEARLAAKKILDEDPSLSQRENEPLLREMERLFGRQNLHHVG